MAAAMGAAVGLFVGVFVGDFVGLFVGVFVGDFVGVVVGDFVGGKVGFEVGSCCSRQIGTVFGIPTTTTTKNVNGQRSSDRVICIGTQPKCYITIAEIFEKKNLIRNLRHSPDNRREL